MVEIVPTIEHFSEHVDAIPEIVSWVHAEWGDLMTDISYETLETIFSERTKPHKIPQTFVALIDENIIGTASMVQHDLSTRPDLSPWMAAVYVVPDLRGKGIGTALVRMIIRETKYLDLDKIYLLTPDKEAFYARLGWTAFDHTYYRGETVTIMIYNNKSFKP